MENSEVKKVEVIAQEKIKKNRPGVITLVCAFGFIGALFAFPLVFSSAAKEIGTWYPPYLAFSALMGLASMIGLWTMKKWGAILYTSFAAITQIVMLVMGIWTAGALIYPGIVVFIAMSHIKDME